MGFKTGKTVAQLGMTDRILELLEYKIMTITHPKGCGVSDGADQSDDGNGYKVITIPMLATEYPDPIDPITIPMENIGKGLIAGHSVFLKDQNGLEAQISFLAGTMDLEKERPSNTEDTV